VRLVDRDQAGRSLLEQRAELVPGKRLGCGQDEKRPSFGDACQRSASIRSADRTVEPDGRHAELLHLEVLILEEGEERPTRPPSPRRRSEGSW